MRRSFRRKRRIAPMHDVSLTPLIDTALTLLIIFMVAAPMMQNAIKVSLPKGSAKEDIGSQQELTVFVDKNGTLFFDGVKYQEKQLIEILQKKMAHKKDQTLCVKADTVVSYGKVIELVDRIKVVGGIKYVSLATQKQA